jgi:hypothetical protein
LTQLWNRRSSQGLQRQGKARDGLRIARSRKEGNGFGRALVYIYILFGALPRERVAVGGARFDLCWLTRPLGARKGSMVEKVIKRADWWSWVRWVSDGEGRGDAG